MNGIRALEATDIPRVAALHAEVMAAVPVTTEILDEYHRWLTSVFLANPMRTCGIESLVYENGGEVVGFLGVVPRQVELNGAVYRAASSSNFCVSPRHRGLIGLKILTEYLSRSPDLAFFDEALDRPRDLSERIGGVTAELQSIRWALPLRPMQHVLWRVRHRLPRPVAAVGGHAARALDAITTRVPHSPYRYVPQALESAPLTTAELTQLLGTFGSPSSLRPVTTDGSTAWLVERARGMIQHGELQMVVLRGARDRVAGWFVYYANPGGQGEVLQLVATRATAQSVLDALAHHASERGVVSLAGSLHPMFLRPLAERWATFDSESRWTMVHSRHNAIVEAFCRGNLLLSRLDGEWCQHFR
jgi:hypothetical protein